MAKFTANPTAKGRFVSATIKFMIPARENEADDKPEYSYGDEAEELWQLWRDAIIDPKQVALEIKHCLEHEHSGICNYDSASVTNVVIS